MNNIMKLADAYAEKCADVREYLGGNASIDEADPYWVAMKEAEAALAAEIEVAAAQLEKDADYEYERGYQQGLSAGRVYKEEARAYKEAFYKVIEQLAKWEALKPQVPIVIMNPVDITTAMGAK